MGRELAIPEGNPYRGLQAFEAQHRALFFGRSAEIRAVVERLRGDAIVVVAGDSGAGKSSLCRAGVLPVVEEGGLEPGRSWASAVMTPGRYPLQTLVADAGWPLRHDRRDSQRADPGEPDALIRGPAQAARRRARALIFVDQLEELVTLGEAQEVATVGRGAGAPGLGDPRPARADHRARRLPDPRRPDPRRSATRSGGRSTSCARSRRRAPARRSSARRRPRA
jgi:ABC-type cobalamin/Fe3+-siderophores transport system ATPase subunit